MARLVLPPHEHPSPDVIGRPLASPLRRTAAHVLDGTILLLPTLAVAIFAASLALRASDRPAYEALRSLLGGRAKTEEAQHAVLRDLAPLLVRIEAPGLPPAVALAVEEGKRDEAAHLLANVDLDFTLRVVEGEDERPLPPNHVRVAIEKLIPGAVRAIAVLGVPALYFTVLTSLFGATIGKAAAGIRVRRLDGERLPLVESFERFTGYLHVPALLGWPLADLWRNPNRQMPHDRTVHTVVVLARGERVEPRGATAGDHGARAADTASPASAAPDAPAPGTPPPDESWE